MGIEKSMLQEDRVTRIEDILLRKQPTLQLMLDNVHSSQNLSAILRSADAVGILYCYYSTADNKELRMHRTITQGAHRWVERSRIDMQERTDFLERKKREGYRIIATGLEEQANSFREADYTVPTIIILGNEKEGVSDQVLALADEVVTIPMTGMVQSLNVSVAAGLLLYEAQRQREEAGYYRVPQLSPEERKSLKEAWFYRDVIARRSKGVIPLKKG